MVTNEDVVRASATDFVLKAKVKQVKQILKQKRVEKNIKASVAFNIDVSGSMKDLYSNGTVQEVLEQIVPIALIFDDNGELDMNSFASGSNFCGLPEVTAENYRGYVVREILENREVPKWGGTDYAPVLQANLLKYGFYIEAKKGFLGFGSKPAHFSPHSKSGYPVAVYMVTDGDNYDTKEAENIFRQCQDCGCNIYFNFVCIGNENFEFLRKMADKYSNVGFFKVDDIAEMVKTDSIYNALLPEELCQWLQKDN